MVDGELTEMGERPPSVEAHFVHQDTFKTPLRHPKTGEIVNSMTRWNAINKTHGLRVVGNDWLNEPMRHNVPDRVTDDKIMDAIYKAESIQDNPDKARERTYENQIRYERYLERRNGRISTGRIY